jgi:hypothetical protein
MKKYYWITKDGIKMDVDSMTESHLKNVLKMIIRNAQTPVKQVQKIGNIESNFLEESIREYEEEYNEFYTI